MVNQGTGALLATHKPPAHQQAVDELQARIRAELASGRRSLFKPPPPTPGESEEVLDQRIAEELSLIVRQLEAIGDLLAADPILLHRYAAQLQSIDLMQQVLGHLGRVVAARDKEMALDRVTLTELKGRLRRRPLRPLGDLAGG